MKATAKQKKVFDKVFDQEWRKLFIHFVWDGRNQQVGLFGNIPIKMENVNKPENNEIRLI